MIYDISEEFVREALEDNDRLKEKSKEISCGLVQQKYDICQFLEGLGFALTSQEVQTRLQGMKLFSGTLNNLPLDYLNEVQLKFIVDFYCDRLKDHHSVLPAVLDGVIALQKMRIPDECVVKLFHNLFQHIPCQSQTREDREKIFEIIKTWSELHCEKLRAMGADFVYGVLSAIDGERDPRNLDLLFTFMPKFLQNFPLYHLSEEMFEVFACYFPIDFQPVKNEISISRDSLASKLADCLVASTDFVEFTISLILEKLDSDLKVAKCDSLELLVKTVSTFPAKLIEPHFNKIWESLKCIIFPGIDNEEVLALGLNSLEELLKNVSTDPEISKHIQTKILGTILAHLSDAHHKLFKPASSIALICVKGDPLFASDKILNCLLLKMQVDECDTEQILEILKVIVQVLQICNQRGMLDKINADLQEKLQKVPMKCLTDYETDSDCVKLVLGYISEIVDILTKDRREILYDFLQRILTSETHPFDLRNFLIRISKSYPEELNDNFLSNTIANFNNFSLLTKERILSNISVLMECDFFQSIILNFFSEHIFEPSNSETQAVALKSLRSFLEKGDKSEVVQKLFSPYNFLEKLINITHTSNMSYVVLEDISAVISLIVRTVTKDDQKAIFDKHVPKLNLNLASDLFVANGIVRCIQKDVNIDNQFERLLTDLTVLSVNSKEKVQRQVSHHLLCSLLNKANISERNEQVLQEIVNKLEKEIEGDSENAIEVLAWLCKALIIRGYPHIEKFIHLIFRLLDHPELSSKAVLAFEIISDDTLRMYLPVVKALFKQKLFNIMLTELDKKLERFSQPHVNAFVYILKTTPQQIIKMNLSKVSPILFNCLESENVVAAGISLEVLKRFLDVKDEFFHSHISHLISHFLRLITFKDSMRIRILALECLESVAKYPTYLLLPHKMDVVLGLVPAIDDKKRLVRCVAVKVRNMWFLIGSSNV